MKALGGVVGTIAIVVSSLIAMGIVSLVVNFIATRNSDGYAPEGISYTRETYISGCRYWARQEPSSKDLSDDFINSYCGCVYDDGVALYGKEKFTEIDQAMSDESTPVSPEINEIINTCITKTFNSGVI